MFEIIHLHECLRGALKALLDDIRDLSALAQTAVSDEKTLSLERRVLGRFRVIKSVFQAHSRAEDGFIRSALKAKINGKQSGRANLDSSVSLPLPLKVSRSCEDILDKRLTKKSMFKQNKCSVNSTDSFQHCDLLSPMLACRTVHAKYFKVP